MIYFVAEFEDCALVRLCLSDLPAEVNAFMESAAPVVNRPPRKGKGTVMWTHDNYDQARNAFATFREADVEIWGNLAERWSSPQ